MNEIKIPKSFMLMGQTIDVRMKDDVTFKDGIWGSASTRENEITLQANANGYQRSQSQIEETFLHELTHFILFKMDKRELNDDEEFICQFSGLLHQAFKTANYGNYAEIKPGEWTLIDYNQKKAK